MNKIALKIVFIMSCFGLAGCPNIPIISNLLGQKNGEGLATSPSTAPTEILNVPTFAYQDKIMSIDLASVSNIQSVEFQNAPSWLTFNSTSKKVEGVPDDNSSISNLLITVSKVDGSSVAFGPYSISVYGDPLRKYQWHIKNNGQNNFANNSGISGNDISQEQTLVSGLTGNGVKVAVSDSGVEIAHEDLSANIIAGASKNYSLSSPYVGDPTPTSTTDGSVGHGTAVAGIIGAVGWNNKGGRGIAPNSKIAGLRYIGAVQNTATSLDQANGSFDVFNYSYDIEPITPKTENPTYLNQLRYGTTSLRSGKGSLYVKSAGNEFESYFQYDASGGVIPECYNMGSGSNGICHYFGNSNLGSPENITPDVIIVGSLNAKGERASYSSPGSNLWMSAPGGEYGDVDPAITTTDIQGCNKGLSSTLVAPLNSFENSVSLNSNCKYTSQMNGTSSAAPVTSGAIALILEANPNLTWRDVKYILAATATKTDSSAISTQHPANANLASHIYQQGWIQNSAGFWFHNWYGFGRVNVDSAVALAKNYSGTMNPIRYTQLSDGSWVYSSGLISQAIPDNSAIGTSSNIEVRHNLIVESVQIKFTTTQQMLTDLGVELTSPSGTKSILLNINSGIVKNTSLSYDAQLSSNAFFGELSAGNWTLKVVDGSAGDVGILLNWRINIVGHVNGASKDSTPPNPITNLTHASAYNSSTTSPLISFTGSSSSDIMRYEISVGTSQGATNTFPWTPIGLTTAGQLSGLSLTLGQTYYVNVRGVDTSENVSDVVSSSGWIYSTAAAPTLTISSPSISKISSLSSTDFTITYSGAANITLAASDISLSQTGVITRSDT